MSKKLFYGFVIQIFISSFMEILLSGFLNVQAPIYTKNGESLGVYVGYISLIITLFILPGTYIWVISRPLMEIENPEFREKWGTFYANTRIKSKWNLLFNFTSILRRFLFVFFVLYVPI